MDTGRTPAAQPAEQRNLLMETWNMERKNTMQPATTRSPYTKDKVDGDLGYGDEDYIHMYNVTDNGASIHSSRTTFVCASICILLIYISIDSSELDIGDDSNDFKYSWGIH
jgi:hypothetical protein